MRQRVHSRLLGPAPADQPVPYGMAPQGGYFTSGEAHQIFWIWPLPINGPVIVRVDWPGETLSPGSLQIEGHFLREGADQARQIWRNLDG